MEQVIIKNDKTLAETVDFGRLELQNYINCPLMMDADL
jgi:hypothetical protein